jgi:hypothetical protein
LLGVRGGRAEKISAVAMRMYIALHREVLRGGGTSLFVSRAISALVVALWRAMSAADEINGSMQKFSSGAS